MLAAERPACERGGSGQAVHGWNGAAPQEACAACDLAWGAAGADRFAPDRKCRVSGASRPALRAIDLGIGARVGCGNVKTVTRGSGMLRSGHFKGAWRWEAADEGGSF